MPSKRRKKEQLANSAAPTGPGPGPGPGAEDSSPLLQQSYEQVCQAVEGMKRRRAKLQLQNEFLQQEAQSLRAESLEFVGYLAKRAQRRRDSAVSLNDKNWQLLREIQQQQQEVLAHFQELQAALQGQLLRKEAELAVLGAELEGLQGVRALKQEQEARLQELHRELSVVRTQHLQRLQEAKARFLREKAACEREAHQQVAQLAQQARGLALRSLQEHSEAARRQNGELQRELRALVQRVRELQAHRQRLQAQAQALRQAHSYAQDVALLRCGGRPGRPLGFGAARQDSPFQRN